MTKPEKQAREAIDKLPRQLGRHVGGMYLSVNVAMQNLTLDVKALESDIVRMLGEIAN